LNNVIQISADFYDSLALTSSGGVTAWGLDQTLDTVVPLYLSGATYVSASRDFTMVLSQPILTEIFCNPYISPCDSTITCQVIVSPPAGPPGDVVSIVGNGPITLPTSVTVQPGQTTASFQFMTPVSIGDGEEFVTGSFGGASVEEQDYYSGLSVLSVSFASNSELGGATNQCTVTLSGLTGAQGTSVQILGTGPAMLPTSLAIAPGASSAKFTIHTPAVATSMTQTVQASFAGVPVTSSFSVLPQPVSSIVIAPTTIVGGANAEATITLGGTAGATGDVVSLTSSSAAVIVPASITIPNGGSHFSFLVKTTAVSASANVVVTATTTGTPQTANVTVVAAGLTNLNVLSSSVVGGNNEEAQVVLGTPAGSSGAVVSLNSNGPSATVPASVTVPAGATSFYFVVKTSGVNAATPVTLTATLGASVKTASFTVNPASLAGITATPSSVTGGGNVQIVVSLSGQQGPGSIVVTLSSSSAQAPVPATVTIGAGSSSYSFLLKTQKVTATTQVTLTGMAAGVTQTATFTITP
jgi:hypothetical protein